MAKAKSKKITIEDALVPVDEQPYEVPENWCWTRVKMLGKEFFDGDWILGENMDPNGKVRLLQLSDIGIGEFLDKSDKHISENTFEKLGCTALHQGDVMISRMAEPIARSCIVPEFDYPVITAVDVAVLRCREELVDNRYLNYLCNAKWFTDVAMSLARGTTRTRITRNNLGDMAVPLPPLSEQQRIVEQIESLFSKLDEAKDRIQTTIDNSEDRRNAIFSKAFSGELTSEWRKQREISLDTWQDVISQDVCKPITCGKTPKEFISSEGEIPYLKVYNIVENKIDFVTTPQFIPREIHEGKLKSSRLKPHDVIMNIVGPPLRKVAIIPDDYADWNMNQAIVRFRPIPELMDYKYLYYELLNPETLDDVIAQTRGVVGQANISVTQSRNLRFKCPTVDEQKEVVRILEGLLEREDEILKISINVIDEISALKKAILAKAFRGELGTNNVEEESAELYLKKILS